MNIRIGDKFEGINKKDYKDVCESLRKRIVTILYLKESLVEKESDDTYKEDENNIGRYIDILEYDLYGMYKVFGKYQFLSCISELEGIKENIFNEHIRKKILDLSNFICKIN